MRAEMSDGDPIPMRAHPRSAGLCLMRWQSIGREFMRADLRLEARRPGFALLL